MDKARPSAQAGAGGRSGPRPPWRRAAPRPAARPRTGRPLLAALLLLAGCAASEDGADAPTAETPVLPPILAPRAPEVAEPLTPRVTAGGRPATALAARPAAPRVQSGIFPGTGDLTAPAAPPRPLRSGAVTRTDGQVELNFVGADVREVSRVILAELLGLDFTIDPAVRGVITVETNGPIPRDAVLPTFEAVLRLSNLAIATRGSLHIVTSAPAALRGGLVGAGQPGFGTEVIAPRYVAVAQIRRLIEPILREGQLQQVDASRNLMLISGTEAERRAARDMIAQFDVDWMRGMSFSLYAARRSNARRLAEELNLLIGGEGSAVAGLVRIVPIERLNAVLAISPQPRYLQQLQVWAERLDREGQGEERQVFVYRVQNGRAADLARVLARAFGVAGGGGAGAGDTAGRGGLGGGQLQGGGSTRGGSGGRGGDLATPLSAPEWQLQAPETLVQGTPDAVPFGGAPAAPGGAPPGQLPGFGGQGGLFGGGAAPGQGGPQAGGLSVTSDDTNNAIVIVATPRQYELLGAALRQLDVLPLQVQIEAAVAEVTLGNTLRFGLQWALTSGQNTAILNQRTLDPATQAGNAAQQAVNALRGALTPRVIDASVPIPAFPGFSYIYSAPNITVVLEALDQITTVNVLSAPQLLVLNNQTASLQVGDQVPIQTQSAQSVATAGAPLVSSIEYRDTGVILRVTPRVNESGLVLLDIAQEVSSVVQAQSSTLAAQLSPTIQQRRIASTVAVQDGQTIALGGLIRDARNRSRGGVPLLSDIPGLGYLFGRANDAVERTELLVMLTPRVVRNQADARAVTEELRSRLRALQPITTPFPRSPGSGRLLRGQPVP
jgi:general secretion pathway protein D